MSLQRSVRTGVFVVIAALVACGVMADPRPEPTPRSAPAAVYVQYHLWFRAGDCPSGAGWEHWSWVREDDSCLTVPGTSWLRNISSPGYPLIGAYTSNNPDVLRWHIRLAQAAGIDGFFVSVYSWADPNAFATFATMLRVAHEEGFKIAIEGWLPDPGGIAAWKSEVVRQLDTFTQQSPYRDAYLRIRGRPAYWFNFSDQFMAPDEFRVFLDRTSVTWVLVSGVDGNELTTLNSTLLQSSVQRLVGHHWPTVDGWRFTPDFFRLLRQMRDERANGLLGFAHGYPGFDESRLAATPGRMAVRFGTRNDGQVLRELLDDATAGNADAVFLESFNDWNEYTMLEPGVDTLEWANFGQEAVFKSDAYRYLKIIAEFKGKEWVAPQPPCSILDPLLVGRSIPCE